MADQHPLHTAVLNALFDRPIAFHPILARIAHSVNAGIMLSQAFYWSSKTSNHDGWFYKTQSEWEAETCLSRFEQETARKRLRELGVIEEIRRGVPARLHFRICYEKLIEALNNHQIATFPHSSMRESSKLVCSEVANKSASFSQSISEITSEITSERRSSPNTRQSTRTGKNPRKKAKEYSAGFHRFYYGDATGYAGYPRKLEPDEAWSQWKSLDLESLTEEVIAGVERNMQCNWDNPVYIPYPARFLKRGGWKNEFTPSRAVTAAAAPCPHTQVIRLDDHTVECARCQQHLVREKGGAT